MSDFLASLTLRFIDQFTHPLQSAQQSAIAITGTFDQMSKNDDMNRLATDLALQAANFDQIRAGIHDFVEVPRELSREMKTSMNTVNSIMNEANAINGDVAASYDAVKEAAFDLPKFKATEFTGASYNMISANLSVQESLIGTTWALKLARSTMFNNVGSASLLATIYQNLGDKTADLNSEMMGISDSLAQTQATFQLSSLSALNEGLKYGIPIAQQYKISMDQVNTTLGQLNSGGLQGSMAGTAFAAMVRRFDKANTNLGVEIAYDNTGGLDVIQTLANIKDQFGPVSEMSAETKAVFQQTFGDEGMRGIALLTTKLDDLQANFQTVSNAAGKTEEMFLKMSAGPEMALAEVQNRWDNLAIKMGDTISIFDLVGAKFQSGILDILESIPEGPQTVLLGIAGSSAVAADSFLGLASAGLNTASQLAIITNMGMNFSNLTSIFGNAANIMLTPIKMMGSGLISLGTSFVTALPAVGSWIVSMWGLAAAHVAAFWPVYAVIGGVAALAALGVVIYKNWDVVKAFFIGMWETLKNTFHTGWLFISGLFDNELFAGLAIAFLPVVAVPIMLIKYGKEVKAFFVGLPAFFHGVFISVKDSIVEGFNDAREFITDSFSNNYVLGLVAVFNPFIGIPLLLKNNWEEIMDFFSDIPAWFQNIGTGLWDAFTTGILDRINAPVEAVTGGLENVRNLLPFSDAKEGPLSTLTLSGRRLITTIVEGVNAESGSLNNEVKRSLGFNLDGFNFVGKKADTNNDGEKGQTIINLNIQSLFRDIYDLDDIKTGMAFLQRIMLELGPDLEPENA